MNRPYWFLLIVLLQMVLLYPTFGSAAERLSNLIPMTKEIAALDGFVTDHVTRTSSQIEVRGQISNKTISVKKQTNDATAFSIAADNLHLKDIVPQAGDLALLDGFSFTEMGYANHQLTVTGAIAGSNIKVVTDKSALSVTSDNLTLPDMIPAATDVGFLKGFSFKSASYAFNDKTLTIAGNISGKGVTVKADKSALSVTSDNLTLPDMIPAASGIGFLKEFSFKSASYADNNLTVTGNLDGVNVKVSELIPHKNTAEKSIITVASDNLTLNKCIPETKGIDFLAAFAFKEIKISDHVLTATGAVGNKNIYIVENSGAVTLKSDGGITLGDIVPLLRDFPGLNEMSFESLTLSENFIETTVSLNKHVVYLVANANKKFVALYFDGKLDVSTLIPINNKVINQLALDNAFFAITDEKNTTIEKIDLPIDLQAKVDFGTTQKMVCAGGINVNSHVNNILAEGIAKLGAAKDKIPATLPLKGLLSKKTFSLIKDGIKDFRPSDFLKEIYLTLDLAAGNVKVAKINLSDFYASIGPDASGNDAELSVHARLNQVAAIAKVDLDNNNHVTFDFEIDGPIKLSDLTSKIPNADMFELEKIRIASNGIEAESKVFDLASSVYLFEIDDALVFAVNLTLDATTKSHKHFLLGKLAEVAGLKGDKKQILQANLNAMAVANAALMFSSKSIPSVMSSMFKNGIAQDMFANIYGGQDIPVTLNNVTFLSDFNADLMGEVGKKLQNGKIGLSSNGLVNGVIGGLYGGDPFSMDLEILMAGNLNADNLKLPKIFAKKTKELGGGAKEGIFLKILDDIAEIGLLAGFDLTLNNKTVGLTGTLGVQLDEDGAGLSLTGTLNDDLNNAFGIPDFKLADVTINATISADSITVGLAGNTEYLGRHMSVADNLEFTAEGLPKGLGFKTTIDKLDTDGWVLVDRTFILAAPTIAGGAVGAVGGGLAGGLIGGVCDVPTGAVPGALVVGAIGVVGGDLAGTAIGGAIGAAAEFIIPQSVVKAAAKKEAFILQADATYLSFATPGADSVDLKIPPGVHFNMDNIKFFGEKIADLKPSIGWMLKIEQELAAVEGGIEKLVDVAKNKVKKKFQAGENDSKRMATSTEGDAKKMAANVLKLNKILLYELGMTKTKPSFTYTKPDPNAIETFKKEMSFSLKNLKLGELDLNNLNVQLIPTLKINTNTTLLDVNLDVEIDLTDKGLSFDEVVKLGNIGDANLTFNYAKDSDAFSIKGSIDSSKIEPVLKNEIKAGMNQLISAARKTHQGMLNDLKNVQTAAKNAQKALEDVRRKESDFIDSVASVASARNLLADAQKVRDGVQGKIDGICGKLRFGYLKKRCQNDNRRLFSDADNKIKQMQDALKDALDSVQIPKDLSDMFAKEQAAVDKATTKLASQKTLVDSINGVEDVFGQLQKSIANYGNDSFSVKGAILAGDLADLMQNKDPLVLEIKYQLNGKDHTDSFGFKLKDDAYNATAFALLPVMALEELVKTDLAKAPKDVSDWLLALMDVQMVQIRSKIEADIANEKEKYKDILNSFETNTAGLEAGHQNFVSAHAQTMSSYSLTDMMPSSKLFDRTYLAVGHSSLCLGVAPNGIDVYQENCKDVAADRWSTAPLGSGYVELKSKGLCLKAKSADTRSGQPLELSACNVEDDHEQWKIISTDGYFDKIVNRFSQKCLHFDAENANPMTAYATWTSCLGADSQTFRDIEDAERPTQHQVEELIKAKSNICLATKQSFDSYFQKSRKGHLTTTKKAYDAMKLKKDDVLVSAACADAIEDKFNYVEMVNGDLKLVHAQSGWCVVPQSKQDATLVLKPCNRNKKMLWRNRREGDAFEMRNVVFNKCMTLENNSNNTSIAADATISNCSKTSAQLINFTK